MSLPFNCCTVGPGWFLTTSKQQAALAALQPMQRQSHYVVPRLATHEVWQMTPNAFLKKYVAMNQPVIFRDAKAMQEAKSLWLADNLKVVHVSKVPRGQGQGWGYV